MSGEREGGGDRERGAGAQSRSGAKAGSARGVGKRPLEKNEVWISFNSALYDGGYCVCVPPPPPPRPARLRLPSLALVYDVNH